MVMVLPGIQQAVGGHFSPRTMHSVSRDSQLYHVMFLCIALIGLGGCATTPNVLQQPNLRPPIKMLVMESPISIDPDRLQSVLAPDVKPKTPVSDELLSQGINHAEEYALASMQSALDQQTELEVVTPPAQASEAITQIRTKGFSSAITQDEADLLQKTTGADALLRFGITDYGLTPRAWRKGYITFEVAATLAIAAIIAYSGSTVAKAAAGTYLIQETAEETAEAYAGFWALDVVSRPVRIEAELVQLNPVATIWEASHTGLSETSLSRLTRKVSSAERSKQLDQSTDDSIHEVVSDLAVSLDKIKAQ
jgi:hypothetical protein